MHSSLKIKTLDSFFSSVQLRSDWSLLQLPSPMQSYTWLRSWWDAYRSDQHTLCLVQVFDGDDNLMAIAPLYIYHRMFFDEIRILGDGQVCSDYASILLTEKGVERSPEVMEMIASWCTTQLDQQRAQLAFESLYIDDPLTQSFFDRLCDDDALHHSTVPAFGSYVIQLPDNMDEYLSRLSKNHRKRCRSWIRKYLDTDRATQNIIDHTGSMAEIEQAMPLFHQMHNERRGELGEAGAFQDELFTTFHNTCLPVLVQQDLAEIRFLVIEGEPMACEYALKMDGRVFAYQSGLTNAGMQHSAGNLSVLSMIRDTINAGGTELDLLRGDEAYKFHWGVKHRPAVDLYVRSKSKSSWVYSGAQRTLYAAQKIINMSLAPSE